MPSHEEKARTTGEGSYLSRADLTRSLGFRMRTPRLINSMPATSNAVMIESTALGRGFLHGVGSILRFI